MREQLKTDWLRARFRAWQKLNQTNWKQDVSHPASIWAARKKQAFSNSIQRILTPSDKLERWSLGTAISLAVTAIVLACYLGIPLFEDGHSKEKIFQLDLLSKTLIFIGAIATLATVIWRGSITSRQASTQAQQLEATQRQIAATDRKDLAQLLRDGLEAVSSKKDDKGAEIKPEVNDILAGVTILHAVALNTDTKMQFSSLAIDAIAGVIEENYMSERPICAEAAIDSAIHIWRETGKFSQKDITIRFPTAGYVIQPFYGTNDVSIEDSEVWLVGDLNVADGFPSDRMRFSNCRIKSWAGRDIFRAKIYAVNSAIVGFTISDDALNLFKGCSFENCTFDCNQIPRSIIESIGQNSGNKYFSDTPPSFTTMGEQNTFFSLVKPIDRTRHAKTHL